jgi:hypothetical protein
MKKLFVLLMILAMLAGCATTSQQTTTEKKAFDEVFADKNVIESINQMQYESVCNKLVLMYALGEIILQIEKDTRRLPPTTLMSAMREFCNRIATGTSEQEALIGMFTMGYNRAPFDTAVSHEMKTCLETEASRMQKYHEIKLKLLLDGYAKVK